MFLMGPKGGKSREAYPQSRGLGGAVASLENRYLTAVGGAFPSPFTQSPGADFAVAYTNVKRTGSGLFVVGLQMPSTLGAADEMTSAAILFGAPSSGGVANGQWFVEETGHLIVVPGSGAIGLVSAWEESASAGNLVQTPTIIGICSTPLPVGADGSIVFFAGTAGPSSVTPAAISAFAFELP